MVSARVGWQQGFEKNYSKIRSYPPIRSYTFVRYKAGAEILRRIWLRLHLKR